MRTEENLRAALDKVDKLLCKRHTPDRDAEAQHIIAVALAEAGEESEMMSLLGWLEKERSFAVGLQTGESPGLQIAAMNQVVVWDSIKAKIESFGYTLEGE